MTASGKGPKLSATARELLVEPRYAVVASIDPDGSPLLAVVWYQLDGETIVFNSRVGRRWPSNLVRDPRVAFIVADGDRYVEVRGRVEIDDDRERSMAVIVALARRYEEDHPDELRAVLSRLRSERRVTFRLTLETVLERSPSGR